MARGVVRPVLLLRRAVRARRRSPAPKKSLDTGREYPHFELPIHTRSVMSFRSENEQYAVRGYRPVTAQEAREWNTLQIAGVLDTASGEVLPAWIMRHLSSPATCQVLLRGSRNITVYPLVDGQPVREMVDERWMVVVTTNPWPVEEEEVQEDTSLFDALQASVEINKLREHVHGLPSQDDHKDVLGRLRDLETLVLSLSERMVEIESGTAPISFRVASPV